jgi:hypothetical protein
MKKLISGLVALTVISPVFAEDKKIDAAPKDTVKVETTDPAKAEAVKAVAEKKVADMKAADTKAMDKKVEAAAASTEVTKSASDKAKAEEYGKVPSEDDTVKAEGVDEAINGKKSNKLPKGLQFGMGLSVLPGHNWFIGYANKDFDSFWWKRIGGRLDLTTPMTLNAKATINDDAAGVGYDINANANLWFHTQEFNEIIDEAFEFGDKDERIALNNVQADIVLKNKNFGAVLDLYPFGNTWFLGGIRLSGGYYMGEFSGSAMINMPNNTPTNGFSYNVGSGTDAINFRVKSGSSIGADFKWKYNGPYAGLGFDLGILWGAKIYMDAGVVFTKAMTVSNNNIKDKNLVIEGCYGFAGGDCKDNAYTKLVDGLGEAPKAAEIVGDVVAKQVETMIDDVAKQIDEGKTPSLVYGGVDYSSQLKDVITAMGGTKTAAELAKGLSDYVLDKPGATLPTELDSLIDGSDKNEIDKAIETIRSEIAGSTGSVGDIQDSIDEFWDEYNQSKADALQDMNDNLKDFKFMPMVKIGFMYRF